MNVPIRRGMIIRHQNHLFIIEDFHERHTGKQKPTVHVRLRDLKSGAHVDRSLDEVLPIREAEHSYRTLQYSYPRGRSHIFMDTQSFDEHELDEAHLHGFTPFLKEGQELRAMFVEGQLVTLNLPEHVQLHVTSTAAPERAVGQGGGVLKDAQLQNGLTVKVPLFIKNGDLISVDTRDRTYAGKEKEAHA